MVSRLKKIFENNSDLVYREISVLSHQNLKLTLVFIDGMINQELVSRFVVAPLTAGKNFEGANSVSEVFEIIDKAGISFSVQKKEEDISKVVYMILNGFCAVCSDDMPYAFVYETKGFERRSTSKPDENVVKGAKDSFIEVIRMNTAMVRRKLKTERLKIEENVIGTVAKTPISVIYIDGIAPKELIEEVKTRLSKITAPFILSLGIVEEQLSDNKLSPFPQFISTERVDKFCANIASGRVGVIIDGFPVAYILPGEFKEFLEAPEDYSQNFTIASFIRILRYILVFTGIFLPGLFISMVSYNPEMLPFRFALGVKSAKMGVPFPAFVEMLVIMIAFEILIEAGIRLPNPAGQIVSIVGGLIVGDAAVSARIVSPVVVMIAAIAAISSYAMPSPDFGISIRIFNFITVIFATLSGLFGVFSSFILLLFLLSKTESYSVPYLTPFVASAHHKSDAILRLPYRYRSKKAAFLRFAEKGEDKS